MCATEHTICSQTSLEGSSCSPQKPSCVHCPIAQQLHRLPQWSAASRGPTAGLTLDSCTEPGCSASSSWQATAPDAVCMPSAHRGLPVWWNAWKLECRCVYKQVTHLLNLAELQVERAVDPLQQLIAPHKVRTCRRASHINKSTITLRQCDDETQATATACHQLHGTHHPSWSPAGIDHVGGGMQQASRTGRDTDHQQWLCTCYPGLKPCCPAPPLSGKAQVFQPGPLNTSHRVGSASIALRSYRHSSGELERCPSSASSPSEKVKIGIRTQVKHAGFWPLQAPSADAQPHKQSGQPLHAVSQACQLP